MAEQLVALGHGCLQGERLDAAERVEERTIDLSVRAIPHLVQELFKRQAGCGQSGPEKRGLDPLVCLPQQFVCRVQHLDKIFEVKTVGEAVGDEACSLVGFPAGSLVLSLHPLDNFITFLDAHIDYKLYLSGNGKRIWHYTLATFVRMLFALLLGGRAM